MQIMRLAAFSLVVMIQALTIVTKTSGFNMGYLRQSALRPRNIPASRLFSHVRLPANDLSLDTNLLSSQPDLVIGHLQSRHSDPMTLDKVFAVKDLHKERNALIFNGDAAKNVRKTLSKEIGVLMKQQKLDEVAALKARVEAAVQEASAADEKLVAIEQSIHEICASLPNLLDDRYLVQSIV